MANAIYVKHKTDNSIPIKKIAVEFIPDYSPATWHIIVNPSQSIRTSPKKYWKVAADSTVTLMDAGEQATADAQEAAEKLVKERNLQKNVVDNQKAIKAFALVVLDEINVIRANAGMSARTQQQLIDAIKAKIDTI